MKVLLLGATGATGKDLLELLLKDDEIQQLDVFVRRNPGIQNERLKIHVIDFDNPDEWKEYVKGDVLFSCLGTTRKLAGSKESQWKVDHTYQYQFAKAAREHGVPCYVLVSAINAAAKSPFFYSRMKGQLDEDVRALHFNKLIIFRPPLLLRGGAERPTEVQGARIIGFFNRMGLLRAQKPISTIRLAEAMISSVKVLKDGIYCIPGQKILDF
ncbi:MAG TPA: NAD(P)H-binding protein [Bacteroidales bacterium]|nr:NAD(P)H-binding protein [Bacteroidales bacterium]HRZ49230.1 NAD(P)H-binding protein [Bacteroidales bacterium]